MAILSLRQGHEASRGKDRPRITDIEANPFFEDPRLLEVIGCTSKKTMIAMRIFSCVIAEAEIGDQLLALQPLPVEKRVSAKPRPEKAANARACSQRSIPVRIEGVGVAAGKVHTLVSEFVL